MRLIITDPRTMEQLLQSNLIKNQVYVFNIGSIIQKYQLLANLIPTSHTFSERTYGLDSKDFDMQYASYILNDEKAFTDMMQIVYPIYEGNDVFCIYDPSDWNDLLIESIAKFIQQRYGITASIISDACDLEYVEEQNFTIQGVYNLDIDKERFAIWNFKQGNYGTK